MRADLEVCQASDDGGRDQQGENQEAFHSRIEHGPVLPVGADSPDGQFAEHGGQCGGDQRLEKGALSCAGWTGDADSFRPARSRSKNIHDEGSFPGSVLHKGEYPRQGEAVTLHEGLDQMPCVQFRSDHASDTRIISIDEMK